MAKRVPPRPRGAKPPSPPTLVASPADGERRQVYLPHLSLASLGLLATPATIKAAHGRALRLIDVLKGHLSVLGDPASQPDDLGFAISEANRTWFAWVSRNPEDAICMEILDIVFIVASQRTTTGGTIEAAAQEAQALLQRVSPDVADVTLPADFELLIKAWPPRRHRPIVGQSGFWEAAFQLTRRRGLRPASVGALTKSWSEWGGPARWAKALPAK